MAKETGTQTGDSGAVAGSQAFPVAQANQIESSSHWLLAPEDGAIHKLSVQPGQVLRTDFALESVQLEVADSDLVLDFGERGTLVLQNFEAAANSGAPPNLVLPDGASLAGDVLLLSLDTGAANDIQPAAGPNASSGGAGEYADNPGDLLKGVDRLGVLGPDSFGPPPVGRQEDNPPGLQDEVSEETTVAANLPPDAMDDFNEIFEDQSFVEEGPDSAVRGNLLSNDSDPEGDPLQVVAVDGDGNNLNIGQFGTLVWDAAGEYTYFLDNANPAVNALDAEETLTETFTYAIEDENGGSDSATLTITIHGTNDGPTAVVDTHQILELVDDTTTENAVTGNVLSNDSDPSGDSDPAGFAVLNPGTYLGKYGSLILNGDGSYRYELDDANATVQALNAGDSLTDETFAYTLTDGDGGSNSSELRITIQGANDSPAASDNQYQVAEDGMLALGGGRNLITQDTGNGIDNDIDSPSLTVSEVNGQSAAVGSTITLQSGATLLVHADGRFSYDPNGQFDSLAEGETGQDAFSYTLDDGDGATDQGTVTIAVQGRNDGPDATDNLYTTVKPDNSVNLILTIDTSLSMNETIFPGTTRLDLLKEAVDNLVQSYGEALNSVMVVRFSNNAAVLTNGSGDTWMTGAEALALVNGLRPGGYTDYDDAVRVVRTEYGTPPEAGSTFMYFLSDGLPQAWDGGNSNAIDATEEAQWKAFLSDSGIDQVYGVGVGDDISASDPDLESVAWSSTGEDADNVVIVADETELAATLVSLAQTVDGNVILNDTGVGSDSDPNGDPLTVVAINGQAVPEGGEQTVGGFFGELTIGADGSFTYTLPEPEDPGFDLFRYSLSDGSETDSAHLLFQINSNPDGLALLGDDNANDLLTGDLGADFLWGGAGDDTLTGNGGRDLFVFDARGGEGSDRITDFTVAEDVLAMSDVLDDDPANVELDIALSGGGNDLELTLNPSGIDPTSVTLEGANSGGDFTALAGMAGTQTLQDVIDAGIQVQTMETSFG